MILFKKPDWLRPEINEPKYWLHLVIIAVVVLAILQYILHYGGEMLTIKNVLISVPLILLGDMVAHTILKLN
jgi:amino acid transporter